MFGFPIESGGIIPRLLEFASPLTPAELPHAAIPRTAGELVLGPGPIRLSDYLDRPQIVAPSRSRSTGSPKITAGRSVSTKPSHG